jgi:hypothetical protein
MGWWRIWHSTYGVIYDEAQVGPLLDAVKVHMGKRGRPRQRLKVIATDKG